MYNKIETGKIEANKKQMVFVLIYCKNSIPNKKYLGKEIVEKIPTVLSLARHDGYNGFVGGKVDEGETLLEALLRESVEEIGYNLDIKRIISLATFADDNCNIHSFKYEIDFNEIETIINKIINAEHFGIEICGFSFDHLYNYINDGGKEQVLNKNWKATAKLELEELILQEGF